MIRYGQGEARCLCVDDVLNILCIPLIEIVPESKEVLNASNVGTPVTLNNPKSAPARAYYDAARRLKGELVPLVLFSRKGHATRQAFWAEGSMRFMGLFGRRQSARTAQHRLQVLLMHERSAGGHADLIPVLREDILAAIGKYVPIDSDKVQVRIERGDEVSLLEIDIEIPALARLMLERRTGPFYPSQACPR